jgi:vacuolar-type H+-ATPase subunit F/Vma7
MSLWSCSVVEIVMVGGKYLSSGFRLAGIETIAVEDDDQAVRRVERLVSEGTYKIILMTEKVAMKLKSLREDMLRTKRFYPVFVIVPDFGGTLDERQRELRQLVSQAIGVKLKLGD